MKFETLKTGKFSNQKKVFVGVTSVSLVLLMSLSLFSYAKYRVTKNVKLASGSLNYKSADLNLVAMYKGNDKDSTWEQIETVPTAGYTLNTTKSKCTTSGGESGEKADIGISYVQEEGKLNFTGLTRTGTKCYVYFDIIRDEERPEVTQIKKTSEEKTSISVEVTARDNIGVTEYWYAIDSNDDGSFTQGSGNTHTFNGLEVGSQHTIYVYVKDAAGNKSEIKSEKFSTEADKKKPDQVLAGLGVSSSGTSNGSYSGVETGAGGVYSISDGDGTSYFWRGAVTNNFVKFAGYCWRIIRINGDGSIRLIYDGTTCHANGTSTTESLITISTGGTTLAYNTAYNDNAYVGYMKGLDNTGSSSSYTQAHTNSKDSTIKAELDKWYDGNIGNNANYSKWIDEDAGFCNDRRIHPTARTWWTSETNNNNTRGYGSNVTAYAPFSRFLDTGGSWAATQKPTLECAQENDLFTTSNSSKGNHALTRPIGLITADEVVFAGGKGGTANNKYYLYNGNYYWTMSPYRFGSSYAQVFLVCDNGNLSVSGVYNTYGVRPVINLKSTTTFKSGNGQQGSPYEVG